MKALAVLAALLVLSLVVAGPGTTSVMDNGIERMETFEETITGNNAADTVDVWIVPFINANTVTVTMLSEVDVADLEIIAVSRKGLGGAARCFRPATRDTVKIDTASPSYSWPFCRDTYDSIGINFTNAEAAIEFNITMIEWR